MKNIKINQELLRQFVYDCFDVIVRDIKIIEEQEKANSTDKNNRKCA